MTALPPDAVADLYKLVAELEQRLESSFAAHDAAIARQAATDAENGRLIHELSIARERQNASADILSTIASVSGDAEHALYQIAETSARLFDASSATIHIAEGDGWAKTIRFGESSKRVGAGVPETQLKIGGRNMPGTIVGENRQVHVPDVDNVDPEIADWPGLPYVREAGTRSMSGSPLRREGKAIGALIVYRDQLAPFTEDELALQQSFADQAAIAIENSRLFNERRQRANDLSESLRQQTATADVLRVIASSPADVEPALKAIVESACATLLTPMMPTSMLKDWRPSAFQRPSRADTDRSMTQSSDQQASGSRVARSSTSRASMQVSRHFGPPRLPIFPRGNGKIARTGTPLHPQRTSPAGGRSHWCDRPHVAWNRVRPSQTRQTSPAADLCGPGRDRHRKRAAVSTRQGKRWSGRPPPPKS